MIARSEKSGCGEGMMKLGTLTAELRPCVGKDPLLIPMQGEEVAKRINADPIASQSLGVHGVIAKLIGYRSAHVVAEYIAGVKR